jgi:acyl-coenzyme A thioesterase PaaI-like protein
MNGGKWLLVAAAFTVCAATLYQSGSAAPAKESAAESLDVRCARAKLRLAELTLQKAQEMNRKVAGTLTGGLIAQFADDVQLAKLQLQNATRPEGLDAHQAYMLRAELIRHQADARLKRAKEADQRSPGVVSANELERFSLEADIAQIRVERGQSLADASPDAKLQWQVDMLNDELARVKEQTYLLGQNRLQQF